MHLFFATIVFLGIASPNYTYATGVDIRSPLPAVKKRPAMGGLKLNLNADTRSGIQKANITHASTHGATHFHGTNSTVLPGGLEHGLLPRGELVKKGLVPFAGEHGDKNRAGSAEEYRINGEHLNERHLSTVGVSHAHGAFEYAAKSFNSEGYHPDADSMNRSPAHSAALKAQYSKLHDDKSTLLKSLIRLSSGLSRLMVERF